MHQLFTRVKWLVGNVAETLQRGLVEKMYYQDTMKYPRNAPRLSGEYELDCITVLQILVYVGYRTVDLSTLKLKNLLQK